MIDGWGISHEIDLVWMTLDFTDVQTTLVQVMAWCCQATSHYLSQRWPISLSPYGVTRPQWVKSTGHKTKLKITSPSADFLTPSGAPLCCLSPSGSVLIFLSPFGASFSFITASSCSSSSTMSSSASESCHVLVPPRPMAPAPEPCGEETMW